LQTSNRNIESEKNKITLERDNLKQERDRFAARVTDLEKQHNNRIESTLTSDTAHRIAELNSVIADLNNQLETVKRETERGQHGIVRSNSKD
jgi:chromosome segregation ATPase